jgi:preprotein translocase subunit YajC
MLADCLINESSQGNAKIIWTLVILLTYFLGALLYLVIRRPQRKRELGH